MIQYPRSLIRLIQALKKLPGVGSKTAERFAFDLLGWPNDQIKDLAYILHGAKEQISQCPECGCFIDSEACKLCYDSRRNGKTLCVVAHPKDIFALEQTQEYQGLYHVLGGLLSPMEEVCPEKLSIDLLKERITDRKIQEVVIALDSTLEGDTTALYLKQQLAHLDLQISRLAFGLPMGSSLDYVDGGTLARAFLGRRQF